MRILFICGCLAVGQDGVGDYTRILAQELASLGAEVRLLSLNERSLTTITYHAEPIGRSSIQLLRLPSSKSWDERGRLAKEWLGALTFDWVSLQFVPFSFQTKGLPIGLKSWLKTYIPYSVWHVMFHETWVGFTRISTAKHRLWGTVQRVLIQRLVRAIAPNMVHTSNRLYEIMLRRAGISTEILPVPSSIPITTLAVDQLNNELDLLGLRQEAREEWILAGVFGTIHHGHDYLPFVRQLTTEAAARGKRLALLTMGRSGPAAEGALARIKASLGSSVLIHTLGERSPAEVSAFLHLVDFGVATIPRPFLGKSSAVAAMRLHSLEVRVPIEMHFPEFAEDLARVPDSTLSAPALDFAPARVAGRFHAQLCLGLRV